MPRQAEADGLDGTEELEVRLRTASSSGQGGCPMGSREDGVHLGDRFLTEQDE